MKTNWKRMLGLGAVLALLAGCATRTTLPVVTGAVVQYTACELARAKPAAKAPLHAAGVTLKAFGSDTPPTREVLEAALRAIPVEAVMEPQVTAVWSVLTAAYGELHAALKTPEQKATLQLWFTQVGAALDNGSQCGPPVGAQRRPAAGAEASAPTWEELGVQLKTSLRQVQVQAPKQ